MKPPFDGLTITITGYDGFSSTTEINSDINELVEGIQMSINEFLNTNSVMTIELSKTHDGN